MFSPLEKGGGGQGQATQAANRDTTHDLFPTAGSDSAPGNKGHFTSRLGPTVTFGLPEEPPVS